MHEVMRAVMRRVARGIEVEDRCGRQEGESHWNLATQTGARVR